jgi:hypothetical protein
MAQETKPPVPLSDLLPEQYQGYDFAVRQKIDALPVYTPDLAGAYGLISSEEVNCPAATRTLIFSFRWSSEVPIVLTDIVLGATGAASGPDQITLEIFETESQEWPAVKGDNGGVILSGNVSMFGEPTGTGWVQKRPLPFNFRTQDSTMNVWVTSNVTADYSVGFPYHRAQRG